MWNENQGHADRIEQENLELHGQFFFISLLFLFILFYFHLAWIEEI